jgi:uncharacterized SAM-binding protein YcdF (DUF218 family)
MASALGIGPGLVPQSLSADILITKLEQRFQRPDIGNGEGFTGVIALGGSPERVREAARLARLHSHVMVIVTGEGNRADVMSLIGTGIGADRIIVEEAARNTYENAVFSSQIIGTKSPGRWLLVTSASHMPRAIGTFRKSGLDVYPWPIFEKHEGFPVKLVVRHEYIGLLAYWLLGRSNSLFPSATS